MKILSALFVLLFAAIQSGCVVVTSYAKLKPQLEQWEKEQQYGQSLDALGQIEPKDPDYAKASQERKQIEKRAADYEQQVRKETHQKLKEGDWAAALDQYDDALARHPKSVVIKDGLAKLHLQQKETLDELELKRLIQHGEWLRDVLPVHQEIARVDPRSSDAQNRLKRVEDEAKSIAGELSLIGNKALADNDLKTADATLPLALKLSNDPVIEASVKSLREQLQRLEQKRRDSHRRSEQKSRAARKKKEQNINNIKKRYDQAFAKQDYLAARKLLAKIEKADRKYKKLPSMRRELQKAIDNKASSLFEAGVSAYSRGQYERAAREWRTVLSLKPDHQQAKENLERAEKVLKKLERLQHKQGS